eukprot:149526-Amorphochlora_amoeboformis.AAC.1
MAPEIVQQQNYDGKVDVWSLGCTCIEMATQHPPNYTLQADKAILKIMKDPPPKLPPGFSQEFNGLGWAQAWTGDSWPHPAGYHLDHHSSFTGAFTRRRRRRRRGVYIRRRLGTREGRITIERNNNVRRAGGFGTMGPRYRVRGFRAPERGLWSPGEDIILHNVATLGWSGMGIIS